MPEVPSRCLPFEEDLSALVDDELDPFREAEVRAHVEGCTHCSSLLQDLCNVDLVLASEPTPAVPEDLRARLESRLAREAPVARLRPRAAPPRRPQRRLAIAAAGGLAAAAAVALAVLLVPRDASQPGPELARAPAPAPAPTPVPGELAPEPTRVAERRVPPVAPEPAPALQLAERAPAPTPDPAPATPPPLDDPAFAGLAEEDVALLLELVEVEELDLIANLDLLEALVDLAPTDGAG